MVSGLLLLLLLLRTYCNWIFLIVLANHSKEYPEDGFVYEPKHVAGNETTTSNKSRVVYDSIIL